MKDNIADAFYPKRNDGDEKVVDLKETDGGDKPGEGEQGGEAKKVVSLEKKEAPEEKEVPEKKEVKVSKEDEETEEEGGLSKHFENNPEQGRKVIDPEFELKEGDYEEKDGKLIVHADHLKKDIKDFLDLEGNDVIRHLKKLSKGNPKKVELLAKHMGFVDEEGAPNTDDFLYILKKYHNPKTPDEEAFALAKEHFPKWALDNTVEPPFVFEKKEEEAKTFSKEIPYSLDDLEGVAGSEVDIYNAKVDKHNQITLKEVMDDKRVLEFVKKNKFNPETGAMRDSKEVMKLVFTEVYKPKKGSTTKPEGGKRGISFSSESGKSKSKFIRNNAKTIEDAFYPKK